MIQFDEHLFSDWLVKNHQGYIPAVGKLYPFRWIPSHYGVLKTHWFPLIFGRLFFKPLFLGGGIRYFGGVVGFCWFSPWFQEKIENITDLPEQTASPSCARTLSSLTWNGKPMFKVVSWNIPSNLRNSHHQDYEPFLVGNPELHTFFCDCWVGW